MPFELIRFWNFRNLADAEIPVPRGQVFFIGENGQGKTNFLEAVYTLCYGRSFRSSQDGPLIKRGQSDFGLSGVYSADGESSPVKVQTRGGKKEILIDDNPVADRTELIERLPCIVFCHEDLDFVRGGPEYQRLFFDQTACLLFPEYLGLLRNYGKILKARNALLKEQNLGLLPVYDRQLVEFGLRLGEYRARLVESFNELFTPIFSAVSQSDDPVGIQYAANWQGLDADSAAARLRDRQGRDLALKTSTSGPHRDKYLFMRDGGDFTTSASTGQMRLMSLLLRLAQASLLQRRGGRKPVLLLDDVLLELDFAKRKRFLDRLPPSEQQFYTFLPDEQIGEYRRGDAVTYRVEGGRFHEEDR